MTRSAFAALTVLPSVFVEMTKAVFGVIGSARRLGAPR